MKAITLTQPWATLVAVGAKRFETRSWNTNYVGPLAIHAAKGYPKWARELVNENPFIGRALAPFGYYSHNLPTGVVVATCFLNSTIPTLAAPIAFGLSDEEISFGDYGPDRWAWELRDARRIIEVPARGALGLWNWEPAPAGGEARP